MYRGETYCVPVPPRAWAAGAEDRVGPWTTKRAFDLPQSRVWWHAPQWRSDVVVVSIVSGPDPNTCMRPVRPITRDPGVWSTPLRAKYGAPIAAVLPTRLASDSTALLPAYSMMNCTILYSMRWDVHILLNSITVATFREYPIYIVFGKSVLSTSERRKEFGATWSVHLQTLSPMTYNSAKKKDCTSDNQTPYRHTVSFYKPLLRTWKIIGFSKD
jgi:hypothetical protein